ncbi:MAG TPA: pirin family protein, partial [Thermoanaerobaculia bacterium]
MTTTINRKRLLSVEQAPPRHWVGNGFPVSSMFSYDSAPSLSPFLLLDYAAPADFRPSPFPRGVGEHPRRGFETVTVVYQG